MKKFLWFSLGIFMAVTLAACSSGGGDAPAACSAKAITAFSLDGVTGTINETAKTISVTMPHGTSVTALVATFATTGASVEVGVTVQVSGTTANNFTSPVAYTVTAADSTTAIYTVTVTVRLPFTNPQRVSINGYSDHAMEPALSRDGQYLFFNNSNAATVNTNLHWAVRIDDLTFQYKGEIIGVNTTYLEAVASMDRNNVFYFVSTRSYDTTHSTIYRGTFTNGTISGVELVPGISTLTDWMVNFDVDISPDGNTLYFVDGKFDGINPVPLTADILIAERSGGVFVRVANGADIMRQINTSALEYGVAISTSGLEIFFTRLEGGSTFAIYASTRSNTSAPFDTPKKIQAITGFVEAPTLSVDEKSLYYHKDESGLFVIYRVTRP